MEVNFKYDENQSVKTNVMACVNWLNNIAKEMYDGRVPKAQNDIVGNKKTLDNETMQIQADIVECVIDEYNTYIGG